MMHKCHTLVSPDNFARSLGLRSPKAASAVSICHPEGILESAENYLVLDMDLNITGPRNI